MKLELEFQGTSTWFCCLVYSQFLAGSSITMRGVTGSDGGRAFVDIDNGAAITVDFYTSDTLINQTLFIRDGLDLTRPHTLHLVYDKSAYRIASQGRRLIRIDSFTVTAAKGIRCGNRSSMALMRMTGIVHSHPGRHMQSPSRCHFHLRRAYRLYLR